MIIDFKRNFDAVFSNRLDWRNGWPTSLPVRASQMDPRQQMVQKPEFSLQSQKMVLGSTLETIQCRCRWTLDWRSTKQKAYKCSDSDKAAIKALVSPVITSNFIKECKDNLNKVGLGKQITLVWMPGHSDVDGNEKADTAIVMCESHTGLG